MMSGTATVRVMSPEEIAARAGGEVPFIVWPQRQTLFAERAMRLRQLARGHAMEEFLSFMADLALAQQEGLGSMPAVVLPGVAEIDKAARMGVPALPAVDWPRDPAWCGVVRRLATSLRNRLADRAPAQSLAALETLIASTDEGLERQADALLHGVMVGVDLSTASVISAALQVYWTHLVLSVKEHHGAGGQPFGRIDDMTVCPCCGSRPTASLIRTGGEFMGQRYLHCSLCSAQWHVQRAKCTHCGTSGKLVYQSLERPDAGDEEASARAAKAAIQAETCDECRHYLKVIHSDRDPMAEPAADDLASVTLDLLVSELGLHRHGVNLMLLFGDSGEGEDPSGQPPAMASNPAGAS